MMTEVEPHRRRFLKRAIPFKEERFPEYPSELDPFGEISPEVELIKDEIRMIRDYFIAHKGKGEWLIDVASPESRISVHAHHDDNDRKALLAEVYFDQSPELRHREVHRFYLYENNVAVKKVISESTVEYLNDEGAEITIVNETIIKQEFVTQDHLNILKFIQKIIGRHIAKRKKD